MEQGFYSPDVQLLTVDTSPLGAFWSQYRFWAPYWRLYWNRRPGARITWGRQTIALTPDRLVAIPPETDFKAQSESAVGQLYIHFLAQAPYDRVRPGFYVMPADRVLRGIAEKLYEQPTDELRDRSVLALALVHTALCHLPADAMLPAPEDERVIRAMAIMDAHLHAPLSNDRLAEGVGMSRNAFIRLFRQVTGMTPQQCYTRRRIDHTCMQLHFTELKLEQIAAAAGFCDRYHFSRTFKRLRGISPAAFRRQIGMRKQV